VSGEKPGRRTQAERRAATRRALLDAAGELFTERGYAGSPAEEIAARAGVTSGALYHHFGDKRGLFRAVVEGLEEELDALIAQAAQRAWEGGAGLWGAMMAGTYAWLDACLRPDVRRILLADGPAVLGWEEWHAIDARYGLRQTETGLRVLIAAGLLDDQPARPLAHLLYGASIEAALYIVTADDPAAARAEAGASLARLYAGLGRGRHAVPVAGGVTPAKLQGERE
jgi:AcrR family transcriptional regulator